MSENELHSFSSRSQMESSSSSGSLQYFDDNKKSSDENLMRCKEERGRMDRSNPDLVLNFRAERIIYPGTSEEDEEEASEKLSAVVEQPEGPPRNTESSQSLETRDGSELNNILQDRVKFLQKTMIQLKEQLKTEVALWKKEKEEFQLLRERRDALALEEATAAARAAAAAYAAESPLSDELGDVVDISSEQVFRELAILEYEKELAKYQDAYSFAQADARYNARRQLIAKAYEQKIIEVERLCNEELEKIQQNANNLQPLKEMALQWRTAYDRGDLQKDEDSEMKNQRYKVASKRFENELHDCHKVDAEVNMMPELFVGKYTPNEPAKRPSI